MKPVSNQYTYVNLRTFAVATLVATLAFAPVMVLAIDRDAHEDRTELRIKNMHAKLKITSAQEELWGKIAQTMRDNAKTLDKLTRTRLDHAKDITAIDDLKSYGEIAEAHADGLKKLTPVFADLYANMSNPQKKEADTLFRYGVHHHGHHKHGHMKSEN